MSNSTAVKKLTSSNAVSIQGCEFIWPENGSGIQFFGSDSILFWVKPSMMSILQPLHEELGEDLYSRLIAFEASKGTFEDYHSMVTVFGSKFEQGFLRWGEAVGTCGWGSFSILDLDWEQKRARIRIDRPWEMKILKPQRIENQIPFLCGKVSGIFSHAFSTNCVAEVVEVSNDDQNLFAVLEVVASPKTLESALNNLHENNEGQVDQKLRAANNSLRRNQARLLDIIETVGEFIWECDQGLQLTYATEKAQDILQTKEKKPVGLSWKDLLTADDAEQFQLLLNEFKTGKKFVEGEFMIKTGTAEERWLLLRVKELFDFTSHGIGYIGSARDISHERDLQAKLNEQQKNSEYAAKMATLGEMAGGIAHEINTPLAVISLGTEQLIEDLEEGILTPDQTKKILGSILSTSERIAKIVQGLRTFARDTTHDPMDEIPLATVLEETLFLCHNRINSHGVRLEVRDISPQLKILCRPTQISQVLLNLLNNALDAIAELKDRWIEVSAAIIDGHVEIRIRDSGPGIPEAVRAKLMQPFFTTKPIGKGTGLGLSISRGILNSHQGSLRVDEKDANTCFVIALPVNKPA